MLQLSVEFVRNVSGMLTALRFMSGLQNTPDIMRPRNITRKKCVKGQLPMLHGQQPNVCQCPAMVNFTRVGFVVSRLLENVT